ncbi:coiled-coil domain-containing protein 14 isoform X1 [Lingula anatina]|uniref:Coiled-coil domain-containing protein 14 isoform X1 n=1 Tax=Lingula anatina TaxID=7574 RepID=A0A1S3K3S9_LINAN|nr:coiled-coil domain-containing protein 14 isoform X1 [Lingula anatina]|eukprot:XP_013417280.1 coiled-coil domain-containing protein 14 isoform X1 [Lingula anatina]
MFARPTKKVTCGKQSHSKTSKKTKPTTSISSVEKRRKVQPEKKNMGNEDAYSLYSTESEDQVTLANKDLQRCAKLLSVMLEKDSGPSERNRIKQSHVGKKVAMSQTKPEIGRQTFAKQTNVNPGQSAKTVNGLDTKSAAVGKPPFNQRLVSSTPDPIDFDEEPQRQPRIQVHVPSGEQYITHENGLLQQQQQVQTGNPSEQYGPRSKSEKIMEKPPHVTNGSYTERMTHEDGNRYMERIPQRDRENVQYRDSTDGMESRPNYLHQRLQEIPERLTDNLHNHARGSVLPQIPQPGSTHDVSIPAQGASITGENKENDHGSVAHVSGLHARSPQESKDWKTLKYLLKESKAVADMSGDTEARRLLEEIAKMVRKLSVDSAHPSQVSVDLAMQPLRSENCQLRRQLRIVNQQLRELQRTKHGVPEKEIVDYEVVHLQAVKFSLEKQLKESKAAVIRLQTEVSELKDELEKCRREKMEMIDVLGDKATDGIDSHKDELQASNRLRAEIAQLKTEHKTLLGDVAAKESENHILGITLQERDQEIDKLQDLVRGLQQSMGTLLQDLQTSGFRHAPSHNRPERDLTSRQTERTLQRSQNASADSLHQYNDFYQAQKSIKKGDSVFGQKVPDKDENLITNDHDQTLISEDEAMNLSADSGVKSTRHSQEIIENEEGSPYRQVSPPVITSEILARHEKERSRYSVTDYFNKYPNHNLQLVLGDRPMGGQTVKLEMNSVTPGLSGTQAQFNVPQQQSVYKGTALDTSLSTISDLQSVTSSAATWTSADDEAFRMGLSNLDDNITKLQHTLKHLHR